MSNDLDQFITDLFGSTKKASTDFSLGAAQFGHVFGTPDPLLEYTEKLAHDAANFLAQFEGTPLFERAVQLCEEDLKIEGARIQDRLSRRGSDEMRDDLWVKGDQLRLQKKQLELELAKSKVAPAMPPDQAQEPGPVAPTAQATGSPVAEKLSALLEDCAVGNPGRHQSFLSQFEGTPLYEKAVGLMQAELQLEEQKIQQRMQEEAERKARPDYFTQEDMLRVEKDKLELELAAMKMQAPTPAEAKVASIARALRTKTAGRRKLSQADLTKLANAFSRSVGSYLQHAPAQLMHQAGGAAQAAAKQAIPRNAAEFAAHAPAQLRQSVGRATPPPIPGRAVPPPVPAAAARPAPAAGGDLFSVPAGPSRFSGAPGSAPAARPMPAARPEAPGSLSGPQFLQGTTEGRRIFEGGVQPTHELAMQGPQGLAIAKRVGAGREVAAAQRSMATGGQGEVLAGTFQKGAAALELLAELRAQQEQEKQAGKLFSLFSGAGEAVGRGERLAAMDAKNKARLAQRAAGASPAALPRASADLSGVRKMPTAPAPAAGSVQAQRYAKRRELTGAGDGWVG